MAVMTAVVGAGGKSSYIEKRAEGSARAGMNVCITTTTHIYNMPDRLNRPGMGDVVYRGIPEGEKLACPGRAELSQLCREFDAVFVEADGSHHHPITQ